MTEIRDGLVQGRLAVLEVEGHRPLRGAHGDGGPPGRFASAALEEVGGPEGRAHEQDLRAFEHEQRHLPRHAAVAVGVVVELVHHDAVDRRVLALAQRHVGEDLGRAADDGGVAVDRGVAGEHPHVLGPEVAAEREELLAHQGLDGRRVEAALALAGRQAPVLPFTSAVGA